MDQVDNSLALDHSIGFDTEEEILDYVSSKNETKVTIGGLIFDQKGNKTLKVTVRFYPLTSWLTDQLWDNNRVGVREPHFQDGGYNPGYYTRGFVHVQNAIFEAQIGGKPKIALYLERMPVQEFENDQFIGAFSILGPLCLMLVFFNTFISNVKVNRKCLNFVFKFKKKILFLPGHRPRT